MHTARTTRCRTGLVVAGLLAVTAALRLAGAGSAPPSPRYKWDPGWHPAWVELAPTAQAAADRIIAGERGPQVIEPCACCTSSCRWGCRAPRPASR
jgi:hypothetical protein